MICPSAGARLKLSVLSHSANQKFRHLNVQSSQALVEDGEPTPIVPRQSGQVGIRRLSLTQHALPLVGNCANGPLSQLIAM